MGRVAELGSLGGVRTRMEQSTKTKLLTVADTFLIEGRGLIVTPPIPVPDYSGPESVSATLRKPSGEETVVQAKLQIPMVSPLAASHHAPPRSIFAGLLTNACTAGSRLGMFIRVGSFNSCNVRVCG